MEEVAGLFAISGRSWSLVRCDAILKAGDAALDECGKTGNSCRIIGPANAGGAGRQDRNHWRPAHMQNLTRYLVGAALLSATLAFVAFPGMALAQSGSAGGSIGNDEKSLSGPREAPRTVEPSKPARDRKPEAPRRAARKGSGDGGGGNFDGAWVVNAVGATCGASTERLVITGGRIAGELSTGQVSPNGSTTSSGSVSGLSWNSSGHFSGRSGSGSFVRSDGCAGRWTASKQ